MAVRGSSAVDLVLTERLLAEGWRIVDIAPLFGVTPSAVGLARTRAGYPPRKRGGNNSPPPPKRGAEHPLWKGGRCINSDGYVLIHCPEHPHATSDGYVREHRLVMEAKLGRYLEPKEVVHHKDENRQNNDPDNLEVYPSSGRHQAAEHLTPERRAKYSEAQRRRRERERRERQLPT